MYDPLIREPEVDVYHPDVEVFCEVPALLKSLRDLDVGPDALDWNEPAIEFYEGLGAKQLTDKRYFRMSGEPLKQLAGEKE